MTTGGATMGEAVAVVDMTDRELDEALTAALNSPRSAGFETAVGEMVSEALRRWRAGVRRKPEFYHHGKN